MKKIVVIPLDERPCNYYFNQYMTKEMPYQIVVPPMEFMGVKKQAGNSKKIIEWLIKETKDASGVVVALDTILYGGIVPSRLHHLTKDILKERMNVLREIKKNNKDLKIYAYQLLMRNPKYSSSEEEPDYYEFYGREIHLYGVYLHKKSLGILSKHEENELSRIEKIIPSKHIKDYLKRREINSEMNVHFIELVKDGIVDFAIIPQDDSSPYGFTAIDQIKTRKLIEDENLELKVYMYPGADEVTNTLLSRIVLNFENKQPLVYIKYSSVGAQTITPLYEDRYLGETVKYQIMAAGGIPTSDLASSDLVLLINAPSQKMRESADINNRTIEYDAYRTLIEYVEFANYTIESLKKPVIIADVAYANGGDLHLFKLLRQKGILYKVSAYAGWNTSSNTLGTAIPQGIFDWLYPNRDSNIDFLALRYIEDVGYCTLVRKNVTKSLDEPLTPYMLDGVEGLVVKEIEKELNNFISKHLNTDENIKPTITKIYSPWNRMFEIGLEVKAKL